MRKEILRKQNINGWHVIAALLERNGRNQSWLAKELHVTPASITQVKTEKFKLSGEELSAICRITGATAEEKSQLYAEVINARFFEGHKKVSLVIK